MEMGITVKDKITGFSGVVTGLVSYITGCDQVLVQPTKLTADGVIIAAQWIDQQRLEVLVGEPIALDNGATPGPMDVAPRK